MTTRAVPKITEAALDEAAARAALAMTLISEVAWDAMCRPPGSRHQWLDGTAYQPNRQGRGVIICDDCDAPAAAHSISGGCPT